MDYIIINGQSIPYPNDFTMQKVPNRVAEITLMNGSIQGDINGWRYEDTTMKWDTLLNSDLNNLLAALSNDEFEITFDDIDGSKTVDAVLMSRVNTKTRFKHNGNIVWSGIEVSLMFPTCYHD